MAILLANVVVYAYICLIYTNLGLTRYCTLTDIRLPVELSLFIAILVL